MIGSIATIRVAARTAFGDETPEIVGSVCPCATTPTTMSRSRSASG
jgi:hypothetical protein